jgi:two-component system response regulator YesN
VYKVLLVDDERAILRGLRHVVPWEEFGFFIAAEARNGLAALNLLENGGFRLVVCDIRMPIVDGLTFIKSAKELDDGVRFVILTGYDDFAYLKEAVKLGVENYLLKPVDPDELSATLIMIGEKIEREPKHRGWNRHDPGLLKDNTLSRLIFGTISSSELLDKAELFDFDTKAERYTVAVLKHLVCSSQDEAECAADDFRVSCKKALDEAIDSRRQGVSFIDYHGEIVVILYGEDRRKQRDLLRYCLEEIRGSTGHGFFASVGTAVTSLMEAVESYRKAKKAQLYHIIDPDKVLYDCCEVDLGAEKPAGRIDYDESELARLMSSGSLGALHQWLDITYDKLLGTPGMTPDKVQSFSISLMLALLGDPKILLVGRINVFEDLKVFVDELACLNNSRELKNLVKGTAEKVYNSRRMHLDHCTPVVSSVLEFTGHHYREPLSLYEVAERFRINPAYLGQLFKKETGRIYSEYVNGLRIGEAKELLATSSLSAKVISLQVGYQNPNYFYRIFKKLVGISPSEFRSARAGT